MTVFLDSSALLSVAIEGRGRQVVLDILENEVDWCASALAFSEALALVPRLSDEKFLQDDVEDAVRLLWDRIHIVPVDQMCLDRAAMIAREQPVHINDAIHLAAADRLPRPLQFVTFDPAQIPVALSMGFDVVSS
ncbi:MAG: type II toxin-antitoxin system VapC family toxin [Actinomycetes bacterium]